MGRGSPQGAMHDLLGIERSEMPARKRYRPWMPEQSFLFPPSPADWLPEDHLARFVREVVEELDVSEVEEVLQSRGCRKRSERCFFEQGRRIPST